MSRMSHEKQKVDKFEASLEIFSMFYDRRIKMTKFLHYLNFQTHRLSCLNDN
eukprot:UN00092